jgi:hypothetical protein
MSKQIKKQLPEPSEEFWDALISSGSLYVECGFCNRIHYSIYQSNNYEDGELEDLERKAKESPDKYIEHTDWIHWGYIDGKKAVYGCPCNKPFLYEKTFWDNRFLIERYFQNKAKKIREFSATTTDLADKVRNSINIQ